MSEFSSLPRDLLRVQFEELKADILNIRPRLAPGHDAVLVGDGENVYNIRGVQFLIDPQVFSPKRHPSSAWFVSQLAQMEPAGKEMIDVGCGSGFAGQYLVLRHGLAKLHSVDITLPAVNCAHKNSVRLGIDDRVTVRQSDVFDGLAKDVKADIIYWNHPWVHVRDGWVFKNERDRAFYDPEYNGLAKYMRDAHDHLKPGGRIFLGFNTKGGNRNMLRARAREFGYEVLEIAKGDDRINGYGKGVPVLYELVRSPRPMTPSYSTLIS